MSSMTVKQEIKSSLRQVIAKEKGKVYMTGELRVIDLAEDCLREIERLEKLAYRDWETDRKSTRLNSSHRSLSRMPSSA